MEHGLDSKSVPGTVHNRQSDQFEHHNAVLLMAPALVDNGSNHSFLLQGTQLSVVYYALDG
jgi:hypothetical protein